MTTWNWARATVAVGMLIFGGYCLTQTHRGSDFLWVALFALLASCTVMT